MTENLVGAENEYKCEGEGISVIEPVRLLESVPDYINGRAVEGKHE